MMEQRVFKYLYLDMHDDENSECLDEYEDEGNRYVSFLFNAPHLFPQKESNHLIDPEE